MSSNFPLTRRSALLVAAWTAVFAKTRSRAAEEQVITVHKDPSCGCCSGWVKHLQQAGFLVKTIETADLDPVKTRLGVPAELAACHTAQIGGFALQGDPPGASPRRALPGKTNAAAPRRPLDP